MPQKSNNILRTYTFEQPKIQKFLSKILSNDYTTNNKERLGTFLDFKVKSIRKAFIHDEFWCSYKEELCIVRKLSYLLKVIVKLLCGFCGF